MLFDMHFTYISNFTVNVKGWWQIFFPISVISVMGICLNMSVTQGRTKGADLEKRSRQNLTFQKMSVFIASSPPHHPPPPPWDLGNKTKRERWQHCYLKACNILASDGWGAYVGISTCQIMSARRKVRNLKIEIILWIFNFLMWDYQERLRQWAWYEIIVLYKMIMLGWVN